MGGDEAQGPRAYASRQSKKGSLWTSSISSVVGGNCGAHPLSPVRGGSTVRFQLGPKALVDL